MPERHCAAEILAAVVTEGSAEAAKGVRVSAVSINPFVAGGADWLQPLFFYGGGMKAPATLGLLRRRTVRGYSAQVSSPRSFSMQSKTLDCQKQQKENDLCRHILKF